MLDVFYDFAVVGVPDHETAARITAAIENLLLEEFNTTIHIFPNFEED